MKAWSKMKSMLVLYVCLLTLFVTAPCFAHYPWIMVSNYNPSSGSYINIFPGWGHRFPVDGFLEYSYTENLKMLNTETGNIESILKPELPIKKNFSSDGTFILFGARKPSFYTKTYEGGKRQSKKGLSNVIKCYHSNMYMKAIVNVGNSKGKVSNKIGHKLEIIPLKNPITLKEGEYLPLKIVYKDKPFRTMVYATYVGFSSDANVFAYTTSSDWSGNAKIKIIHPGIWLIKVSTEKPYKNKDVCDVESYVATLTFEVK